MPSWQPLSGLIPRILSYLRRDRHSTATILRHVALTEHSGQFRAASIDSSIQDATASLRARKARRKSPSGVLEDIAILAGLTHAIPVKVPGKVDLSYVSVAEAEGKARRASLKRGKSKEHGQSIQSVLASYILRTRLLEPEADVHKPSLTAQQVSFLLSRGYHVADLKTWASIFCESSIDIAVARLLAHSGAIVVNESDNKPPLPVFLAQNLLRRRYVGPAALRSLLIYASYEMHHKLAFKAGSPARRPEHMGNHIFAPMDNSTMLILVIRLLRHARKCWPEAMPAIAKLFIDLMACHAQRAQKNPVRSIAVLYNRMLRLLSLPSNITPYHSVAFQERAQFDLIQKMAANNPPLPITGAGYRGILNVQLANKKTDRERDWDNLKARSWPPWKEEKTGIDAEKGVEYGTSRALAVQNRARAAGYGAPVWSAEAWVWDRAAGILAGWDFDRSPTIQTRTFLPYRLRRRHRLQNFAVRKDLHPENHESGNPVIWAARIRATRTIEEAWACFLVMGWQKSPQSGDAYMAVLEKLAFMPEAFPKEAEANFDHSRRPLNAGDSKETTPNPQSPKEATYVKIQPPTFDALATEMLQKGFVFGGHRVGFFLKHAPTFSHGLRYLKWISDVLPQYAGLLSPDSEHSKDLRNMSPYVMTAFIEFLCRFPSGDPPTTADTTNDSQQLMHQELKRTIHGQPPLFHAFRILRSTVTAHRPKWLAVLKTLADPKVLGALNTLRQYREAHFIRRWHLMQQFYQEMHEAGMTADVHTLLLMCKGLESALLSAHAFLSDDGDFGVVLPGAATQNDHVGQEYHTNEKTASRQVIINQARSLLETSAEYMRSMFHQVMGTGKHLTAAASDITASTPVQIPRLLAIPNSPTLHVYVRVLGLLEDWQGIFDLVRWMVKYEDEITAAIDMPRHGPRALRRTVVAIRVYLECSWKEIDNMEGHSTSKRGQDLRQNQSHSGAPLRIIHMIKRQICSVEAWGGWPTDEEVEAYVWRGRFPK